MAARSALGPAVGKRRGGVEAAGAFPGAFGPGDPKWVEGHRLLPSPAICPLPAGTRSPAVGSPPPPGRHDVVAGAHVANARASAQPPGSLAGVLGATARGSCGPCRPAPGRPGAGGGGQAGLGARCSPSLEPGAWAGRPSPRAGQRGSATPAAKGQPRRGPERGASSRSGRRCPRTSASCSPRRRHCLPNGREGRHGPRRAHDDQRPRFPARLASGGCSFTSPRAPGPSPKGVPACRPSPAPRGPLAPTSPHL